MRDLSMSGEKNKKSDKFRFRLGAARKTSLFGLTAVFLVLMGLIIYGDFPLNVNIIAATVIIVFLSLVVIIYFFVKDILRKLQEAYGKIQLMSITDELTQLYNRRHFFYLAEKELARTYRYKRDLGCIVLDIDQFIPIRDKLGYKYSDRLIRDISEILSDNSRVNDIITRYDNDRFVTFLPETNVDSALVISKRIRSLIEGLSLTHDGNKKSVRITASIGVTSFRPASEPGAAATTTTIDNIISVALKAVKTAKEQGGNRVESIIY